MKRLFLFALFLSLLTVFGGGYYLLKTLKVSVSLQPDKHYWGPKEEVTYVVTTNLELPVGEVDIYIKQGNKTLKLYEGKVQNIKENLIAELKNAGFKEDKAEIIAILKTPLEEKVLLHREVYLDFTPPQVNVIHYPHKLKIGYPGVVKVSVSEPVNEIYIKLGENKFPLLPVGNNTYKTLITAPLFLLDKPEQFFIVAKDRTGNVAKVFLPIKIIPIKLIPKRITLSDKQLKELVWKFFPSYRGNDLVNLFRKINHEFRREDEDKLKQLCKVSENKLYAKGVFLQLPGSAVKAVYGELRHYYYKGKEIDKAIHKGVDLAKYKHAPVIAANNGKVAFVGKLKIYGNVILVDHGFGLFTIYAHLNDATVKEGELVKKGQVIGHTDSTGLALGDHLHFGVLIWGFAANAKKFFYPWFVNYYLYNPFKEN
jgi:murein DD-endopeptidase MepM/ murein hydrolase activator NlpD